MLEFDKLSECFQFISLKAHSLHPSFKDLCWSVLSHDVMQSKEALSSQFTYRVLTCLAILSLDEEPRVIRKKLNFNKLVRYDLKE